MKNLILLSLLLFTTVVHSQINTLQDRPEIHWSEIESENFKVVFPTHMNKKAQYILNLLENYRSLVSETYDIETEKLTVIIRSEFASPNGFVTLAPRRSEWYSAAALSPAITSLDWYQTLAVHEFRHIVQYDMLKTTNVRWGYYLFGEFGQIVLQFISVPSWYYEGDAVHTETVLTNGGRGRSPRFSARLKSLLINDQVPTYDELLGGVYDTYLPNHYVYGYFLITRTINIYGKKVWQDIVRDAGNRPYNPWTLYNSFERNTGENFEDFYWETVEELKRKWQPKLQERNDIYTRYEYPIIDGKNLYYLKWNLDSFWELHGPQGRIKDFYLIPDFSRIDVKRSKFAYTNITPHFRYGYKTFSNLYVYDISKDEKIKVVSNKRIYHPQIHPNRDEIMVIEFENSMKYSIKIYDFDGNEKNKLTLDDYDIAEATYLNDNEVIGFLLDNAGRKLIARINLNTKKFTILKDAGRNNLYNLSISSGRVYFEADNKGVVNIFSMDLGSRSLSRCSDEKIAAYRPFVSGNKIHYVSEIGEGQKLNTKSIKCSAVKPNYLTDYQSYLGKSPSDNWTKSKPVKEPNFVELKKSKTKSEDYFEPERGFKPHSWSFIGGRGYQLQATATNYLNTVNTSVAVGENIVEKRPFASLNVAFSKYYPILNLGADYQERKSEDAEWTEANVGLGVSLPYIYRRGLYQGRNVLTLLGQSIQVSNREDADLYDASNEQLFASGFSFSSSLFKDTRYREFWPSWGYSLLLNYTDAKAEEEEDFSSYLGYGLLQLYMPGFKVNDGFRLDLSGEFRPEDETSYRIQTIAETVTEYAFSRGYDYEYVDNWQKAALNYLLPVSYPNWNFKDYFYFNRVLTNVFFDHTRIVDEDKAFSLNSTGVEFLFESNTFRKIPIIYGLRVGTKLSEQEDFIGFFISAGL